MVGIKIHIFCPISFKSFYYIFTVLVFSSLMASVICGFVQVMHFHPLNEPSPPRPDLVLHELRGKQGSWTTLPKVTQSVKIWHCIPLWKFQVMRNKNVPPAPSGVALMTFLCKDYSKLQETHDKSSCRAADGDTHPPV